jgi:hypothetical protein
MPRPPDETSIRLDAAMREVMERRGSDANADRGEQATRVETTAPAEGAELPPAVVNGSTPDHAPMHVEYDREVVREIARQEIAAALAESDLAVEMGVLTAAVEHLKQRVDVLVEQLDRVAPDESGAGRSALLSGLRSMSTGRSGRSR